MAGKRKTFLNYAAAQLVVAALALTSMQDWIAYAKGKDAQGRIRPDDIPSNPWTVYKDELAEMGKKFSINEFIGCKKKRQARTPKADKPARVPRTPKADKTVTEPVAPVESDNDSTMTPFEIARDAIRAMNLSSRDAFNALKKEDKLPVGVPRNPDSTFKAEWKGWGDFLGNKKSEQTVEA